jgi:selenocysteine lyase/cysteine desulfurase
MYVSAWPGLSPRDLLWPKATGGLPYPLTVARKTYFYRARNAIYHLGRALGLGPGDGVLVPDYHSGNETAALRATGATLTYYPIRRDLTPDFDALMKLYRPGLRALLAIHFMGWPQPMAELCAFCRGRDLVLIEDCALALLSELDGRPLGSFGDFAVFCLYKTLPLPNGGLLVQNGPGLAGLDDLALSPCGPASLAGRNAELLLEWVRARADVPGRALFALKRAAGRALRAAGAGHVPVGDMGFETSQVDVAISSMCEPMMRNWDYERIVKRRRRNFHALRDRLAGRVSLLKDDLPEGVCPLFFPILSRDKHAAAQALWARGVSAVEFWNEGDAEARGEAFADAQFLRDHVLELPIHQDLSLAQIDYVADQVLGLESDLRRSASTQIPTF